MKQNVRNAATKNLVGGPSKPEQVMSQKPNSSDAPSAKKPGETIVENHIKNNKLNIIVKPNAPSTKIIEWDTDKEALRVEVKGKPEGN